MPTILALCPIRLGDDDSVTLGVPIPQSEVAEIAADLEQCGGYEAVIADGIPPYTHRLVAGGGAAPLVAYLAVLDRPYSVEVVADGSGKYCGNGARFHTYQEAVAYARNLERRWTLVSAWRVCKDGQPVSQ